MTNPTMTQPWADMEIAKRAKYWQDILIGHANFEPDVWIEAALTEMRDAWSTDRAALVQRVAELEAERAALYAELADYIGEEISRMEWRYNGLQYTEGRRRYQVLTGHNYESETEHE